MIGLINYGGGNYQSVANALNYLDLNFIEINNDRNLKKVSHIILPGVGSYDDLVVKLRAINLFDELIYLLKKKNHFYLGICVGMQILSTYGLENQKAQGLNLIDGSVEKIPVKNNVIPNIGWHNLNLEKKDSHLFKGIDDNKMFFYFLHSYHFNLKNQMYCSSSIFYDTKLISSVENDNIFGVQFHPEKSQISGLKILKNFCNL